MAIKLPKKILAAAKVMIPEAKALVPSELTKFEDIRNWMHHSRDIKLIGKFDCKLTSAELTRTIGAVARNVQWDREDEASYDDLEDDRVKPA